MKDLTLVMANWNQRLVMELCLKSYVKHHYTGEPLKLMLIENGSNDDSKRWLAENQIPFIDLPLNIGHESGVNAIYKKIDTQYCLLVDTDVQFVSNTHKYLDYLDDKCILAGDLISGDNLGTAIKPRIGAWYFLWDIARMKSHGIIKFRDTHDHSYDTASWQTEQIFKLGYTHHQINRTGDIDRDVIGMNYQTFYHLGKMSWATSHHHDRIDEIAMRLRYVKEQLPKYADVELKGKFI